MSRRLDAVAAASYAAAVATVVLLFWTLHHDDAFILFQYARNLATGQGLVFNPGERVFGFTAPLYTLILAAVYAAFGEVLDRAAILINAAAVGAQAWLVFLLLRERVPLTAYFAGLLCALDLAGGHRFLALETNLFAALALGAIWAAGSRRRVACGVLLGLAFLCRYDGLLLVPIVAAQQWLADRRLAVSTFAAALLVALPWLVFAWIYYGSPLPATLGAKRGLTGFWEYLDVYLRAFTSWPRNAYGSTGATAALTAAAALGGLAIALLRLRALLPLVVFSAAQLLLYAWLGPPIHRWHMAVPHLCFKLLAVLAVFASIELLVEGGARRARAPLVLLSIAGVLTSASVATAMVEHARQLRLGLLFGVRHARYSFVADWLEQHAVPSQVFLAMEVGTLGYLTGHRMLDPYGLITPVEGAPRERWVFALIRRHRPDLVLLDSVGAGLRVERAFGYRIAKVFAWKWLSSTLLVRDASVLREPEALDALREALPPEARPTGGGAGRQESARQSRADSAQRARGERSSSGWPPRRRARRQALWRSRFGGASLGASRSPVTS